MIQTKKLDVWTRSLSWAATSVSMVAPEDVNKSGKKESYRAPLLALWRELRQPLHLLRWGLIVLIRKWEIKLQSSWERSVTRYSSLLPSLISTYFLGVSVACSISMGYSKDTTETAEADAKYRGADACSKWWTWRGWINRPVSVV